MFISRQRCNKMREDLIVGFYGDKKKIGYKGVIPKRVLKLTKSYEKDILEWINKHQMKDLKDYKSLKSAKSKIEPDDF